MSAPSGRSPFHSGTTTSNNSHHNNGYHTARGRESFGSSIAAAAASPSLVVGNANSRMSLGMMSSSHPDRHVNRGMVGGNGSGVLGLSSSMEHQPSSSELSISTSFSGVGGGRNSYYSNSLISMGGGVGANDTHDMMITPDNRNRQQTTTSPFWNPHLPLNPKGIDLSGASARVKNGKKNYTTGNTSEYVNDLDRRYGVNGVDVGVVAEAYTSPCGSVTEEHYEEEETIQQTQTRIPNNNNEQQQQHENQVEENEYMRKIAENALQSANSPEVAVFYSEAVYARTQSPHDAVLLSKALGSNDEPKRAVSVLHYAHLLLSSDYSTSTPTTRHKHTRNITIPADLYIEASLLASKCLSTVGEWQEACNVIENVCRFPLTFDYNNKSSSYYQSQSSQIIQHADDPRLLMLARHVTNNTHSNHTSIHPVARLCYARGKIYDILSNPARATTFLQAALKIDSKCVHAFQYLMERNLLTKKEAHDLVHLELQFRDLDVWLKDFYLAHLVSHAAVASDRGDLDVTQQQQQHLHTSVHIPDQSSIYPTFTPSPRQLHSLTAANLLASPPSSPLPPSTVSHSIDTSPLAIFRRLYYTHNLQRNTQILTLAAQSAFEHYHTELAAQLCSYIHTIDPHCPSAAYIHAASLLSLSHKRLLYHLGHKLVQSNPRLAQSWFVVGCYYHLSQKYDIAQRHFCRATRLDPRCAQAWIAFGCAFAAADESDQALAAFRAAQRLHPSSHLPMLYIGMEYLRTSHLTLSNHFLSSSHELNPFDPLPVNELGVIAYMHGDYSHAVDLFLQALSLHIHYYYHMSSSSSTHHSNHHQHNHNRHYYSNTNASTPPPLPHHLLSPPNSIIDITSSNNNNNLTPQQIISLTADQFWEPTLFNLGQSLRKIKDYNLSILSFQQAISLKPTNAASYAALAFSKHCSNDLDGAIDYYHKALSIKPDHTFSMEMLHRALEEITTASNDDFPFSATAATSFTTGTIMEKAQPPITTANTTRLQNLTIQNSSTNSRNRNNNDDYDTEDADNDDESKVDLEENNSSSGMEDESSSNFSLDVSMMS